jgi:hypothetical protein
MDTAAPTIAQRPTFFQVTLILLCGFLVTVFSLNGVLRKIGEGWNGTKSGNALLSFAAIPDILYNGLAGGKYFILGVLVRWVLLSLTIFVGLLVLNSIRYQTINIVVSGVGGLLIGIFALTWISLFVFLIRLVFLIVGLIFAFLYWVIAGIFSLLLWTPVLVTLIVIVVLACAIPLVAFVKDVSLAQIWIWFKGLFGRLSVKPLLFLAALVTVFAGVWFVLIPLWLEYISPIIALVQAWLNEHVIPILAFLLSGLGTLLLILLGLAAVAAVLYVLGKQFIDQLKSARWCGKEMHRTFCAGFSIGAAAGLALLVCSANSEYRAVINGAWASTSPILVDVDIIRVVYALMPASAESLLQGLLIKASPPIFDFALLVLTLFLANCSLVMGLLSGVHVEPLRQIFSRERLPPLFSVLFGVFIGISIVAAGAIADQD